jgi:hypothetical protein
MLASDARFICALSQLVLGAIVQPPIAVWASVPADTASAAAAAIA